MMWDGHILPFLRRVNASYLLNASHCGLDRIFPRFFSSCAEWQERFWLQHFPHGAATY